MKQKILLFLVCFSLTTAMAANQRFKIAGQGKTAQIVVDNKDWQSVIRAAQDLGDDVRKVSGTASEVIMDQKVSNGCIIVATVSSGSVSSSSFRSPWSSYCWVS